MTLDELDHWLDVYGRAWERQDVDAFVACFTEDAVYQWGPFGEPLRGHAEIRARTEEAMAEQEDIRFGHEPLAITPDGRGVARWWVPRMRAPNGTMWRSRASSSSRSTRTGSARTFASGSNADSRPADWHGTRAHGRR